MLHLALGELVVVVLVVLLWLTPWVVIIYLLWRILQALRHKNDKEG